MYKCHPARKCKDRFGSTVLTFVVAVVYLSLLLCCCLLFWVLLVVVFVVIDLTLSLAYCRGHDRQHRHKGSTMVGVDMSTPGTIDERYCTVLYCTVLYCIVLHSTVLQCTVLYSTYCTVRTVLHCTALGGQNVSQPLHQSLQSSITAAEFGWNPIDAVPLIMCFCFLRSPSESVSYVFQSDLNRMPSKNRSAAVAVHPTFP